MKMKMKMKAVNRNSVYKSTFVYLVTPYDNRVDYGYYYIIHIRSVFQYLCYNQLSIQTWFRAPGTQWCLVDMALRVDFPEAFILVRREESNPRALAVGSFSMSYRPLCFMMSCYKTNASRVRSLDLLVCHQCVALNYP